MSDEVKMPDPKVEAARHCEKYRHMAPLTAEIDIRSLMARTLRAAAASFVASLQGNGWCQSCGTQKRLCPCWRSQFINDEEDAAKALERMASEIEQGQ